MEQDKNRSIDIPLKNRLDWATTIVPFVAILALCSLFMIFPGASPQVPGSVRFFSGDQFGGYYFLLELGALIYSLYMALSCYNKIELGNLERPRYSSFQWGSMMSTAELTADTLLYSLCEWVLYAGEPHIMNVGAMQGWASTYPLLHWSPVLWSSYIILAISFGFMLHVHERNKQKYSETCRPFLGRRVDDALGELIDLTVVFASLAGIAATFSLVTPLPSVTLSHVLGIPENNFLTIGVLIIICIVYTMTVYFGMQDIAKLATSCVYLFFELLAYFLLRGGKTCYIIETGITAVGNMMQNFVGMATRTDAIRTSSFPQDWTIFYWAYWMVWCVITPSFIDIISKGKTIHQTVPGGYFFGLLGTFTSFITLSNYGLGLQMHEGLDLMGVYAETGDLCQAIISIFETVPTTKTGLILLTITMVALYATSFDALTMVAGSYSHKSLGAKEELHRQVELFWAMLLMLLPIALVFTENSMANLQTVSIIAAFPIGLTIVMIVWSLSKDTGHYLDKESPETRDMGQCNWMV